MDSNIGTATALPSAIEEKAGLENVTVTDHADGSLTIRQKTNPFIDGAEVATNKANVTFEYDDVNQITVGGAWTEGQHVSMDIFGETVSFKLRMTMATIIRCQVSPNNWPLLSMIKASRGYQHRKMTTPIP